MSLNLSSKNLFHFTNEEFLKKILERGFYAMYCREEIFNTVFAKKQQSHYIPMVSFCNIPLTMIKDHCKLYGSYGIGLTNKWGRRNKINPVLYSYRNSTLMEIYNKSQKGYTVLLKELEIILKPAIKDPIQRRKLILDKIGKPLRENLVESLLFLKPLRGKNKHGETTFFYDEKEWRYIPMFNKRMHRMYNLMIAHDKLTKGEVDFRYKNRIKIKIPIKGVIQLNKKILSETIQFIESYKLSFEPDDIKFIILKRDNEIPNMINHLGLIFKKEEVKILTTKIITLQQLNEDF